MPKYKLLRKQFFKKNSFSLVPIRYEDRLAIMEWRNQQIYHLRQNKPLTEADQNHYFENVVNESFNQEQPNQILFSYLERERCIGYGGLVHINWIDKNAEISFIMATQLEKDYFYLHWKTYLALIEQVAFDELNLHKIYTYAFDLRPHFYKTVESVGYTKEAVLKEHSVFNGNFKDVVIHSKINTNEISYRKATEQDIWLVYDLAIEPSARANSFHSGMISREDHRKWFLNKVQNENSLLIIAEIDNKVVGMVRFDNNKDRSIVGINIEKDFRGKGLSSKFLKNAFREYLGQIKTPVVAYIKEDNIASKKTFEKAGYQFVKKDTINQIRCNVLQYE